jgi:hypothetical protein
MSVQTLREIQSTFARGALGTGPDPAIVGRIAGDGIAPERRLAIYRNNVLSSLRRVLEGTFPASRRLLGRERFEAAALAFIRAQPPERPQLSVYGATFPAFLEHSGVAAAFPHLPDVARLEWAREEAYYAADAPPLALAELAAVPVALHPELRFDLHPSLRLVRSDGPVHSLWLKGLEHAGEDPEPAPSEGPEQVLVVRPDMTVSTRAIAAADLALLEALGRGMTLSAAAAHAEAADPAFDLRGALALHLAGGSFAGCG